MRGVVVEPGGGGATPCGGWIVDVEDGGGFDLIGMNIVTGAVAFGADALEGGDGDAEGCGIMCGGGGGRCGLGSGGAGAMTTGGGGTDGGSSDRIGG